MKTADIVAILGDLPLMRGLSPEHIQSVASCATVRTFAAGDYVWRQGERSEIFYLIQSGQVALEISLPGQGPLRIEILYAGEVLGCSSVLESRRCQFDARTLTPVTCIAISGERLRQLMEADQSLGYALLKRLTPVMAQMLESARLRLFDTHVLDRPRAAVTVSRPDGNAKPGP